MEKTFKFELTINELNLLLNALANMPYGHVFSLIEKIQDTVKESSGEDTKAHVGTTQKSVR